MGRDVANATTLCCGRSPRGRWRCDDVGSERGTGADLGRIRNGNETEAKTTKRHEVRTTKKRTRPPNHVEFPSMDRTGRKRRRDPAWVGSSLQDEKELASGCEATSHSTTDVDLCTLFKTMGGDPCTSDVPRRLRPATNAHPTRMLGHPPPTPFASTRRTPDPRTTKDGTTRNRHVAPRTSSTIRDPAHVHAPTHGGACEHVRSACRETSPRVLRIPIPAPTSRSSLPRTWWCRLDVPIGSPASRRLRNAPHVDTTRTVRGTAKRATTRRGPRRRWHVRCARPPSIRLVPHAPIPRCVDTCAWSLRMHVARTRRSLVRPTIPPWDRCWDNTPSSLLRRANVRCGCVSCCADASHRQGRSSSVPRRTWTCTAPRRPRTACSVGPTWRVPPVPARTGSTVDRRSDAPCRWPCATWNVPSTSPPFACSTAAVAVLSSSSYDQSPRRMRSTCAPGRRQPRRARRHVRNAGATKGRRVAAAEETDDETVRGRRLRRAWMRRTTCTFKPRV